MKRAAYGWFASSRMKHLSTTTYGREAGDLLQAGPGPAGTDRVCAADQTVAENTTIESTSPCPAFQHRYYFGKRHNLQVC